MAKVQYDTEVEKNSGLENDVEIGAVGMENAPVFGVGVGAGEVGRRIHHVQRNCS